MCYRIIFFKMWSFAVVRFLCFFMCNGAMCCMIPGLGPDSIIKMAPYQYRKSHCGDKTISRSFYLHNGISYTGNRTSLYWIGALLPNEKYEYELFIACSIVAEDQQTGDWTFKSVYISTHCLISILLSVSFVIIALQHLLVAFSLPVPNN